MSIRLTRAIVAIAALAALLGARPALASSFFVITSEADSRLYTVDTVTGTSTLIGATGVGFLSDIAISSSGAMFGTNGFELFSIDATSAATTPVGSISGVTFVTGLDFDSSGTLWGVDEGTNEVWTIDTSTAAATLEFTTGIPFNGDIAHDAGDIFYANGPLSFNNNLWELDAGASSFADRGTMVSGVGFTGLDFDDSGTLWAFTSSGDIYEIQDFATSANGVFSAASGLSPVSGAAFQVPEPSVILVVFGAGAALWRRRLTPRARS